MSGIIRTIKAKDDNNVEQNIFPKTVLEAVVDSETNETLDVILDNLNEKIDNFEPSGGGGTTYELSRTDDTITLTGEDGSSSEVNISDKINTSHIAKVKDYLGYSRNLIIYDRVMYRKGSSGTTNGVQYTILDDYSLLLNGTATADIYRPVGGPNIGANENLGELMASGCPAGGNSETGYCLRISVKNSSGEYDTYYDIGQGVKFTPEVLSSGSSINVTYIIKNGTSLNNVIFYPMVCIASEADGTYEPNYGDGNGKIPELENNKVSKSGDTMTGDLTVKANVNIPLLADNSDTTMVTVPTAGTVDIGSTEQKITDVLTSYKSFMGSIHTKDAWSNIISTRHRNGVSDGVSHGMYLRSLMNRSTPDLMWAVQAAGTWQSERAILDSGNYSTQIPVATQSAVGLMSAADKKKLDGIATGANKITVDSSLSNTSTNPVQNKVVHSHMAARLEKAGGTMTGDITFNNDKGIKGSNGNVFLARSASTVNLASIAGKYPIYVGGHPSINTDVTYLRGYNLYFHSDQQFIISNRSIAVHSDKRVKTNESLLVDEIEKYNQFFNNLQPRKYNYIRDEEGEAKSTGFFAQEVHQALLDAGLSLNDFGGLYTKEAFIEGQAEGDDEAVWYEDFYSLAYTEFIPIIVAKIQYLEKMYNTKLEEIQNDYNFKLQSLEEKINKLEEAKV